MKFLIDMNLSPDWLDVFTAEGWEAVHWSAIGDHRATDEVIMKWARDNAYVIVTHDLDFSALLAATRAIGRAASSSLGSHDRHRIIEHERSIAG